MLAQRLLSHVLWRTHVHHILQSSHGVSLTSPVRSGTPGRSGASGRPPPLSLSWPLEETGTETWPALPSPGVESNKLTQSSWLWRVRTQYLSVLYLFSVFILYIGLCILPKTLAWAVNVPTSPGSLMYQLRSSLPVIIPVSALLIVIILAAVFGVVIYRKR